MKSSKQVILAMILLLSGIFADAAHHPFYGRFSSWDGLPESPVSTVCQDGFGRIWVGTRAGAYYYTGEKYIKFDNPDFLDGCSANIAKIILDAEGFVWIATSDGVGYYDPFSDVFTLINDLDKVPVRDIEIALDGLVWLTSSEGIW